MFVNKLTMMNHPARARILLVCFVMLMVLVTGSCARKRKLAAQTSKRTHATIAPVCALEVSPPTVLRGDHLGISAKASAPGFTDNEVTWEYRWEIIDAGGRIVPVSDAGPAIEVPTARLTCGLYRVMTSVVATEKAPDCRGDCVTTGQTTCTATFEVAELPCPEATCEIIFKPGPSLTFRATAAGVDNPAFTWKTTAGSLSSATGAEVTLELGDSRPGSVTVTASVSTGRTRCDQACPGASSSITLTSAVYQDFPATAADLPPVQPRRPGGPKHPARRGPASETPGAYGGDVSTPTGATGSSAHAPMPRGSGNQTATAGTQGDLDIDTQLERLKKANAVFNTPESMSVGETRTIQLLLGLNSVPELEGLIKEPGTIEHATNIRISNQMEAKLTGEFAITEITPSIAPISMKEVNEWKWDIKAERSGTLHLNLALNVILFVEGNQRPRTIKTFEREITVPVVEVPWSLTGSIVGFVKSEWKWLWSVLLVPLASWIWRRLRKPADNS